MKKQIKKLNLNKRTISNLNVPEMNQHVGGATNHGCPSPSDSGCGTNQGHTCGNGNTCDYYGCSGATAHGHTCNNPCN